MNRRAVDSDGRPGVDEKFSSRRARAAVTALAMFVVALLGAAALLAPTSHRAVAIEAPSDEVATAPTTTPLVTRPPISANDFIPEDQDLTTCIGVLERPGCGSESRGGWHQTFVLIALLLGLVVVFGNVIRGVYQRDH